MKYNRIYLSPPHMGEKERKYFTDACPEFTEISKGIRFNYPCNCHIGHRAGIYYYFLAMNNQ